MIQEILELLRREYILMNIMPAESVRPRLDRYALYSTDDERQSVHSERSESLTLQDSGYVDLTYVKETCHTGNGDFVSPSSPAISTTTTDKWGSYWSRRERCCCFCNFVISITLVVLATIVVMASKGLLELKQQPTSGTVAENRQYTSEQEANVVTRQPCTTPRATEQAICSDDNCTRLTAALLSNMNTSVNPCQDFYSFACGGYKRTTFLTWDSPRMRSSPDLVLQKYYGRIIDNLAEDVQSHDSKEVKDIKMIFQSCIQFKGASQDQVMSVMSALGGFEYRRSPRSRDLDLSSLLSLALLSYGVSPMFHIDVTHTGHIGLTNRFSDRWLAERREAGQTTQRYRFLLPSDFLMRNEKSDQILQSYKRFIGDILAWALGVNDLMREDLDFRLMVDDVYHIWVYIQRAFYEEDAPVKGSDLYTCASPVRVEELQYRYNYNISWSNLLNSLFNKTQFSHNYTLCFTSLSTSVSDVISSFPFVTFKRYIILYVLLESDLYYLLPKEIQTRIYMKPMQRALFDADVSHNEYACAIQISRHLSFHYLFSSEIPAEFSNALEQTFKELASSVEAIIQDLYWMPHKQKQHLLTVLNGLYLQPEWVVNGGIMRLGQLGNVSDDYWRNMLLMTGYSSRMYLVGNPHNRLSTQGSNIFSFNDKVLDVSSAITQLPFVDAGGLASLWFGSVGTQMAQSVAQLFDIDALLRLLTQEKIDHRVALTLAFRSQCLVEEYSKYQLAYRDGLPVMLRGDLTKSANFKDALALRISYNAYMKNRKEGQGIPELPLSEEQLFFVSYAQSFCEKTNFRGTQMFYIGNESHHVPGKYRVLGTLSHFKKFSDAFKCETSSAMNPQNKCSLF